MIFLQKCCNCKILLEGLDKQEKCPKCSNPLETKARYPETNENKENKEEDYEPRYIR